MGEDAWQACQRELKEELGFCATKENSEMIAAFKRIDSYNTIWIVHTDVSVEELILQKEEVSDVGVRCRAKGDGEGRDISLLSVSGLADGLSIQYALSVDNQCDAGCP